MAPGGRWLEGDPLHPHKLQPCWDVGEQPPQRDGFQRNRHLLPAPHQQHGPEGAASRRGGDQSPENVGGDRKRREGPGNEAGAVFPPFYRQGDQGAERVGPATRLHSAERGVRTGLPSTTHRRRGGRGREPAVGRGPLRLCSCPADALSDKWDAAGRARRKGRPNPKQPPPEPERPLAPLSLPRRWVWTPSSRPRASIVPSPATSSACTPYP